MHFSDSLLHWFDVFYNVITILERLELFIPYALCFTEKKSQIKFKKSRLKVSYTKGLYSQTELTIRFVLSMVKWYKEGSTCI